MLLWGEVAMKFTIDRLNDVRKHYSLLPYLLPADITGDWHEAFNDLDRVAEIDTGYLPGHDGCCVSSVHPICKCRRYVGARLALHEAHIKHKGIIRAKVPKTTPKPYFWLGADAA